MYPFFVYVEIIRFCANSFLLFHFSGTIRFYTQNSCSHFPHFFWSHSSLDMPNRCSCHRSKCPRCDECSRCSCNCTAPRCSKWRRRRRSNSNNIYYGESSEGDDSFRSPPVSARAQNSGGSTPGTRSSSQATSEASLPAAGSKKFTTIKDIRVALGLPEGYGRGIPSSKDRKEKQYRSSAMMPVQD
jgi:hypothetical protein